MCPQSTKKINYNFVVTDKENLALFEETASFVFLKENHWMLNKPQQDASLQVPCGAVVQKSALKDIYINEIKQPKLKKDGSCFKENLG